MPAGAEKFRFLADEMIHADLVRFLIRSGHSVLRTPKGFKNGDVYRFAKNNGRVLITQDKDFADIHRYPAAGTDGILCVRIQPPTIGNLIEGFKIFLAKTSPADIQGKLTTLE